MNIIPHYIRPIASNYRNTSLSNTSLSRKLFILKILNIIFMRFSYTTTLFDTIIKHVSLYTRLACSSFLLYLQTVLFSLRIPLANCLRRALLQKIKSLHTCPEKRFTLCIRTILVKVKTSRFIFENIKSVLIPKMCLECLAYTYMFTYQLKPFFFQHRE